MVNNSGSPFDDLPEWPAELAAAASDLDPSTHQPMIRSTPSRGPDLVRPRSSPYPTLEGTLCLTVRQRDVLDAFRKAALRHWPFWINHPQLGRKLVAFDAEPPTLT